MGDSWPIKAEGRPIQACVRIAARSEQVLALLDLGWSYRRIQVETGVHRDTVSGYDAARRANPAKTFPGSESSKSASFLDCEPADAPNPAKTFAGSTSNPAKTFAGSGPPPRFTAGVSYATSLVAFNVEHSSPICAKRTSQPMWLRLLNSVVFFWVDPARLENLRMARAYRKERQLVLTVKTRKLVETYGPDILLSDRNTGTTSPFAHSRGRDTFLPILQDGRRRVVELAVKGQVPDIRDHVIRVEELGGEESERRLV